MLQFSLIQFGSKKCCPSSVKFSLVPKLFGLSLVKFSVIFQGQIKCQFARAQGRGSKCTFLEMWNLIVPFWRSVKKEKLSQGEAQLVSSLTCLIIVIANLFLRQTCYLQFYFIKILKGRSKKIINWLSCQWPTPFGNKHPQPHSC